MTISSPSVSPVDRESVAPVELDRLVVDGRTDCHRAVGVTIESQANASMLAQP